MARAAFSIYLSSLWLLCSSVAVATPLLGRSSETNSPFFYQGFDLSSLGIMEDAGYIYKNSEKNNVTMSAEDILVGMNVVRLRLWVDATVPFDDGYYVTYNLEYVVPLAKRFYDQGYRIYLDYHFSNYWADPNKQRTPPEWPTKLEPLAKTLRKYVSNTMMRFDKAGVDLSLVSLGNEIRNGILWPIGQVSVDIMPEKARVANFTNLATLLSAARNGVRDAVASGVHEPQVLIHIDDGYNKTLQETWFSSITATGLFTTADWDVFGFSFYPFYGTAATLKNLRKTLHYIARKYQKPVQVVETDWPAVCSGPTAPPLSNTKIPVSAAGQSEWVDDIVSVVKSVPGGLGQGVNYWEPAWLNNTGLGSACQDAILFNVDWSHWPNATAYSTSSVNMFAKV